MQCEKGLSRVLLALKVEEGGHRPSELDDL